MRKSNVWSRALLSAVLPLTVLTQSPGARATCRCVTPEEVTQQSAWLAAATQPYHINHPIPEHQLFGRVQVYTSGTSQLHLLSVWAPGFHIHRPGGDHGVRSGCKCHSGGYSTDAEETEPSSVSGYADSTVDLIEELEQPGLLGWSLGGDIFLYIAEFYPYMVNRVVVADTTSGGLLGNAGLCRFEASLTIPKELVTPQQIAGQNSATYGYYGDPQSTVYHALGNITTDVLVIAGTLDEVVSVQDDILVVDMIPGASFLQFADAGHAATLQHAVEAGEVISAFLDV
ncbi:hypothetical protein WJX77_007858 [Trebouxia sp. C0004]